MGAYTDYVNGLFAPARQALQTQIGNEQNAGATKTMQSNLAQGTNGPVATALVNQNQRQIGNQGNQMLSNLDTAQRQAQYGAFQQDRQEQIQQSLATNQMWEQGISGAGNLAGNIAKLFV